MFEQFFKKKITTVSELESRGLKILHRYLQCFSDKFTFESPSAISNTLFHGDCSIGYLSFIRQRCTVSHTDIGRFCGIAPNAYIGGGEHPVNWLSTHTFQYGGGSIFQDTAEFNAITGKKKFSQPKGRITIGNDVWIGQGVNISRGVTIGDGAIIAAHAVVTKDVAPYTIVGGVPAAPIRPRFSEDIIARLLNVKWWNYDLAPIAGQIDYSNIHSAIELIESSIAKKKLSPLKPGRYTVIPSGGEFHIK